MKDASWSRPPEREPAPSGSPAWGMLAPDPGASPGLVATTARLWNVELRTWAPSAARELDVDALSALVVLGYDPSAHRVIDQAIGRDLPILAVGSGARLLAATLGAPVRTEVRVAPVLAPMRLTDDGCVDPVLGAAPSPVDVVQRELDGFELPERAVALAWSPAGPARAFRVRRAYGVPFHLEMDAEIAARWGLDVPPEQTLRAGLAVLEMFARLARTYRPRGT